MPRCHSRRIEGAAALGLGLAACSDPPAAPGRAETDPASWQAQYRGDPGRRGLAPPDAALDGTPRLVWRTRALGIGTYTASKSSPAVDDERLYVGEDDGRLYALERATGKVVWAFATHRHEQELVEPPADGAFTGIHGSPAIDAERVYVGDYAGFAYAVDKRTGGLAWEVGLGGSIGASPALDADGLFLAVEEPTPDGRVFGLRAATGEREYQSGWLGGHPHSSVSRRDGALFVGSNAGALVRLEPPAPAPAFTVPTTGAIKSTAAVADDARGGATAYFTSGDGRLHAVDAASGAERFTAVTGNTILSSPAIAPGRVVFGSHDGLVRCVDAESGEPRWSFDAGAWVSSSPTLVLGSDLVVIGTNAGEILGLGLAAGELRFRLTVSAPVTSVPVVVGRSLFVNDDSGTVYRFDGE